ncbi:MAG: MotA/TolQ/ExbB proton channel family protein [Desulfomonilia bacterium]|jgi:biopolymer transport protein ExbB/TolQ
MHPILLVSIIAFALFCERASYLFLRLRLDTDQVFQKIVLSLEKYNFRAAIEECTRIEKHPLGRILKAGLIKSDKRDKEIERAMEEELIREIPRIKGKTNLFSLFANIATLIGLLGAIHGLITAFEGVAHASDSMKQEILASGISVAMLTTAFGLLIAIPCLIGFYIINNKGESLIDELEHKALRLFNILSSLKHEKELQC